MVSLQSIPWGSGLKRVFAAPLRLQICIASAVLIYLFVLVISYPSKSDHLSWRAIKISSQHIQNAAQNETLGFAKVFYVSLPQRTDRQDAMELLAASSNITLTYQAGIFGSDMSPKAKPQKDGFLRDSQWGCWRSHADVWRRVINEKLESALILEDDVDWDENVHDVFHELSKQMRRGKLRKQRMSGNEIERAPYGFDWDVLYIGTCYDIRNPSKKRVIYDDPHAPTRANITSTFITEIESFGVRLDDSTHKRVLAPSYYPVCTIGYAVTQEGAQRLLYNVGGVKGIGSPLDLAMNDQVKRGFLRAYTVLPPLVTTWKEGGVRDSDIDDMDEKKKELKEGEALEVGSKNLLRSARLRMNETLGALIDPIG